MSETILLRVRKRRGAITAASTLRVELDAALAAADAFNDWDINTSDDDNGDQLAEKGTRDVEVTNNHTHHRVSMSSRRQSTTSLSTSIGSTASAAIFRRIESSSHISRNNNDHDGPKTPHKHSVISFQHQKRPRILDAVLFADSDDDEEEEDCIEDQKGRKANGKKRRRLTLQLLGPRQEAKERHSSRNSMLKYPILSPEQRAINDSLHQVFAGSISLQRHCHLMYESMSTVLRNSAAMNCNDQKLGNNNNKDIDMFWSYRWCHTEYGNWLHAAAIWNEAAMVREIFDCVLKKCCVQLQDVTKQRICNIESNSLIRELLRTRNGEGFNPIQVAQLSGNTDIQTVLEESSRHQRGETFVTNGGNNDHSNSMDDEDDNHEYDLYSLVVSNTINGDSVAGPDSAATSKTQHQQPIDNGPKGNGYYQNDDDDDDDDDDQLLEVTNCELHNGCRGYWDERGNLILEAPVAAAVGLDSNDMVDDPKGDSNNHGRNNDNDDDIDSNDEDWNGNDYPDEDEDNELFSDDDDDESGNERDCSSFRHRHVNMYHHRKVGDDDEDDEDDAHYDPSYGDIYGQSNSMDR